MCLENAGCFLEINSTSIHEGLKKDNMMGTNKTGGYKHQTRRFVRLYLVYSALHKAVVSSTRLAGGYQRTAPIV